MSILIAYQQPDMAREIARRVRESVGRSGGALTIVRNQVAALARAVSEEPRAVIIDIDLPKNRSSGPVPQGGLQLAAGLRKLYPQLPLVLIAASTSRDLSQTVCNLGNAALVLEGLQFFDNLTQALARGPAPAETQQLRPATEKRGVQQETDREPVRYVVEFHLRSAGDCIYHVRSTGDRVPERYQIPFRVEPLEFQALAIDSELLRTSPDWLKGYERIGERLCNLLLAGNLMINRDIGRLQGIAQGRPGSQIALCFVVDKDVYPIALEALRDCHSDVQEYWLERAPVWRQLNVRARIFPLFQPSRPTDHRVTCLVINADPEGEVKSWGLPFDQLPGVTTEAEALLDHLRSEDANDVGKVGYIRQQQGQVWRSVSQDMQTPERPFPGSFADNLRQMLTEEGPWDLVHFAGHTHYDAGSNKGYLLLPGAPTQNEPVTALWLTTSEFSRWLVQTRLVYMSSCSSTSYDFVFNFCKHATPAVTGFRWDIEDEIAVIHAHSFYGELFSRRSIEDAMRETWLHMRDRVEENRAWASSQLVMQFAA